MNDKAIFEIGNVIHVRNKWIPLFSIRRLTAKEIVQSIEFKEFQDNHPELCRLALGEKDEF